MSTAHEIALEILPHLSKNVLLRHKKTYSNYAQSIGRPSNNGLAIGQAMHTIGAICILCKIPVAPIFWVEREDGQDTPVFFNDDLERMNIIDSGHFDLIYITSREYLYSKDDFEKITKFLSEKIKSEIINKFSPHDLWHLTFKRKPQNSEKTYYERAISEYKEIFQSIANLRASL